MHAINATHLNEAARQDAESGMRVEGMDRLPPGAMLLRFVQRADVKDEVYQASPWWFQAAALRCILQAARAGHRGADTVAEQARRMAALSLTWPKSGANYLLAARVAAPIVFFWGAPKPVGRSSATQTVASGLASGSDVIDVECIPDPRCVQFYVPGMADANLARKAFRVKSRTRLDGNADLARGDIEVFLHALGVSS